MDNCINFLHNLLPSPSFRAVYHAPMMASTDPFTIHVVGYNMAFHHQVFVPQGVPCWFFHLIQSAIPLRDRWGIHEISPPIAIIYPPLTPLYLGQSEPVWYQSWIRVSGTHVLSMVENIQIPVNQILPISRVEEHLAYLLLIHAEVQHPYGKDMGTLQQLFSIWLRNIRRDWQQTIGIGSGSIPLRMQKVKAFIESSYLKPVTLREIAKQAGISVALLCKEFKRIWQCSPIEWVIRLRLNHAQELLCYSNRSIAQVAEASGFPNPYYFSRLFRKRLGVSPLEYRKRFIRSTSLISKKESKSE